jgi:hypothetical protein
MYELIVLSLLISGRAHGYFIIKILNDLAGPYTKFSHGRLYPLLARLEKEGFMKGPPDTPTIHLGVRRPPRDFLKARTFATLL